MLLLQGGGWDRIEGECTIVYLLERVGHQAEQDSSQFRKRNRRNVIALESDATEQKTNETLNDTMTMEPAQRLL
jgi:hypothetical protein